MYKKIFSITKSNFTCLIKNDDHPKGLTAYKFHVQRYFDAFVSKIDIKMFRNGIFQAQNPISHLFDKNNDHSKGLTAYKFQVERHFSIFLPKMKMF